MTIRIMNTLLGAVALGLAIAGGSIAADASVRLPAEQISGMPSLAALLKLPINMVRFIADQLLKYGEVRRGRLGITFDDPTPALIRSPKLSAPVARSWIMIATAGRIFC